MNAARAIATDLAPIALHAARVGSPGVRALLDINVADTDIDELLNAGIGISDNIGRGHYAAGTVYGYRGDHLFRAACFELSDSMRRTR